MSSQTINYVFNVTDNGNSVLQQMEQIVVQLNQKLDSTTNIFDSFGGKIVAFQQLTQVVENTKAGIDNIFESGKNLNSLLADHGHEPIRCEPRRPDRGELEMLNVRAATWSWPFSTMQSGSGCSPKTSNAWNSASASMGRR